MSRVAIELFSHRMEAAYRGDRFHALRRNLDAVRTDEWALLPPAWSTQEFGTMPELSFCDLALHVASAKHMYADRAFGPATLEWADLRPPSLEMADVLDWMDEGHRALAEGLAALTDDEELAAERPAPWRTPMTREGLLNIVINHDLYHSGEINRQRALLRGTNGWLQRPPPGG